MRLVVAQTLEELVVWQLAEELRQAIVAASASGSCAKDFKLCSQVRAAANSASAKCR